MGSIKSLHTLLESAERAIWQVFEVAVRVIFLYHIAKFVIIVLITLLTVL